MIGNILKATDLGPSVPQRVRVAARDVSTVARHVRINEGKIKDYAAQIMAQYPIVNVLEPHMHAQDPAYVLALDSINFGSGYFAIARSAGLNLEYDIIAKSLKAAFEDGRLDAPQKWQDARADDFHDMLSIPKGAHLDLDDLMQKFSLHLRETGAILVKKYNGDVISFISSFGRSGVSMVDEVAAWPSFRDVSIYNGKDVPIFKRAQILAADLNLVLQCFDDISELTIFADNMVPHVLRCDGILEYTDALAQMIDRGTPLIAGSAEEIELRCAAIHAVELMRETLVEVTSVNIDHILWGRGYEITTPYIQHRTLTVNY